MKKIAIALTVVLILALILAACGAAAQPEIQNNETMKLLADSYEEGKGSYTFSEKSRLFLISENPDPELMDLFQLLGDQFAANQTPTPDGMPMVWGTQDQVKRHDVVLQIDGTDLAPEGYRIQADSRNIHITGADNRGLMYGVFTVIKYLRANECNTISGCTVEDAPEAAERVVMIDCGRKYFTPQWIMNFIREMAYMGYNAIELHFSDDQGTRFDIWDPEYYTTNVNGNDFSWICGGYVGSWVKPIYHSYSDVNKTISAAEIHEIMMLAKAYQMEVIPAMDSPGHCQYLCRVYANNATTSLKFHYDGKTYGFFGIYKDGELEISASDLKKAYPNASYNNVFVGNHITLDVTNPYGRAYILAIIEDYARFFKQYGCDTFHIGGDEVRLHTNGYGSVEWSDYVQPGYSKYDTCIDYINEQTQMLKELGYTVRAFNDFMDYTSDDLDYDQHIEFDPDIEISYWIAPYDLETAPSVEHFLGKRKIYNCLQNYCYYALTESDLGNDGRDPNTRNWDFYYSTEDRIYEYWNPTVFQWPEDPGQGTVLNPEDVAGGYFLVWCDNAAQNTEEEIWNGLDETGKYNITDRMWSNIAKMWNYQLQDTVDFETYAQLRDLFGHFPGYTGCSEAPFYPNGNEITPAK